MSRFLSAFMLLRKRSMRSSGAISVKVLPA
nr:MAG TPA: hypothetical protein [Caudoviricetes sp.]